MSILKDFLLQLAFIATLIFIYQIFFAERFERNKYKTIILAALFGLCILLCMSFPVLISSNYRVDIRLVPLLLGTLYGGWRIGLVLSALIILNRSFIGVDLGLYTTIITLSFSMPVFLYVQRFFSPAKMKKRIRIAVILIIYNSLVGLTTVYLIRGIPLLEVLQVHYIHIIINLLAVLFFTYLSELIRNIQQMQSEVKDAEIAFLRSQIKPHFLYNTLNSIAVLCIKEPHRAEELTLDFSQYLRRSFDFKQLDSLTTLENELELIKAYLNIEKVRFGARLIVKYDVDANLEFRIPSLILQPLVENAVRHGLMSNLRGGTVKITIRQKVSVVSFVIEDNGCGMSELQVREILKQQANQKGVGLWNITQRIQLLYGNNIHVESTENVGTKISFDIPAPAMRIGG